MSTDEQLPAMIEPNEDDPRIKAALAELQKTILDRFPDVQFRVEKGADLDAIWLVAIADVDDLDDVTDLVISRTVDMQVNEGLPVYVVGNWPPERVREHLRRQPPLPPIDPADPFPILSA